MGDRFAKALHKERLETLLDPGEGYATPIHVQ